MIKVPSPQDAFQAANISGVGSPSAPPFYDFFYYLFVGCAPSATIGTLEMAYNYEFEPSLSAVPICNVD